MKYENYKRKNLIAEGKYSKDSQLAGKTHGEGNGNPLQYSCLESSMDKGTWWATV